MPKRGKIDIEKIRASLNTPCPDCGHDITPAERTPFFRPLFAGSNVAAFEGLTDEGATADAVRTESRGHQMSREEREIGEIFGEIKNKIQNGYNLREIIDQIDELPFRSQAEKHELSHLYDAKILRLAAAH